MRRTNSSKHSTSASSSAGLLPMTPAPAHQARRQPGVSCAAASAAASRASTASWWRPHGTDTVCTDSPRESSAALTPDREVPCRPGGWSWPIDGLAAERPMLPVGHHQVERLAERHVDSDADVLRDDADGERMIPRPIRATTMTEVQPATGISPKTRSPMTPRRRKSPTTRRGRPRRSRPAAGACLRSAPSGGSATAATGARTPRDAPPSRGYGAGGHPTGHPAQRDVEVDPRSRVRGHAASYLAEDQAEAAESGSVPVCRHPAKGSLRQA